MKVDSLVENKHYFLDDSGGLRFVCKPCFAMKMRIGKICQFADKKNLAIHYSLIHRLELKQ